MDALPHDVIPYKRTPIFTEKTIPEALTQKHCTQSGCWALLRVQEGTLCIACHDGAHTRHTLTAGTTHVVPPQVPHQVLLEGPVAFSLTFYRVGGLPVTPADGPGPRPVPGLPPKADYLSELHV